MANEFTVTETNCSTGETITRPMTKEEIEKLQAHWAERSIADANKEPTLEQRLAALEDQLKAKTP
jgi:hypothetical protein